MIYVLYLCVAVGVTFLSIKAADYVDWIDKKTLVLLFLVFVFRILQIIFRNA